MNPRLVCSERPSAVTANILWYLQLRPIYYRHHHHHHHHRHRPETGVFHSYGMPMVFLDLKKHM
jgi:hypothetical protein